MLSAMRDNARAHGDLSENADYDAAKNDQGLIYRTFDRGAQAVVVPHVNTREEAEKRIKAVRYFTTTEGWTPRYTDTPIQVR